MKKERPVCELKIQLFEYLKELSTTFLYGVIIWVSETNAKKKLVLELINGLFFNF